MNCPVCDAKLRAVEKHGVEVDLCPDCKGIWLDRGELEKLLELAATGGPDRQRITEPPPGAPPQYRDDQRRREHHDHDDSHHDREHGYDEHDIRDSRGGRSRRRGSWLSDLLGGLGGD